MKAWRIPLFGIENLELVDLPEPSPGPGEVLIRVRAVSLNFRDLLLIKGLYNPNLPMPRIPCSDGAGDVVAISPGVSTVKVGDRVAGIFMQNWLEGDATPEKIRGALGGDIDGVLAEYVVLHESGVIGFPTHFSFAEAATLPCAGVTAWNAMARGNVGPGDSVLIQGTGGVSIFALQFAKLLGARVFGTSSSDEKLEHATRLGLDAGVNYERNPDWAAWVLDQTSGRGADLVVEVGGAATFQHSLKAVRMGGTITQIGVLSGTKEAIDLTPILHKQINVRGIYVGSRSDFAAMNAALEGDGTQGTADRRCKPHICKKFPLDAFPAALRRMESGAHFGKLVIEVE